MSTDGLPLNAGVSAADSPSESDSDVLHIRQLAQSTVQRVLFLPVKDSHARRDERVRLSDVRILPPCG